MPHDLAAERDDYTGDHLLEQDAPGDPYALFATWMEAAFDAKDRGELPDPTAVVIATVSAEGRPSARTVLLKGVDAGGFVVYTNYDSRKAQDLAACPYAALLFHWYALHRQVRIEGSTSPVAADTSDAYFASRPRDSQLAAWASSQSSELASLGELQDSYAAAERRFSGGEVPRPQNWGGYRIEPDRIEFWQGQPSRMHDRLLYRRDGQAWSITRLAP